jgi:hypothetical protein
LDTDIRRDHRWVLQTQQGVEDWQDVGYSTGSPMTLDDPEPKRWQGFERFAGRNWRVVHITTTTTTKTEIVR